MSLRFISRFLFFALFPAFMISAHANLFVRRSPTENYPRAVEGFFPHVVATHGDSVILGREGHDAIILDHDEAGNARATSLLPLIGLEEEPIHGTYIKTRDTFGASVAIWGNLAVVGCRLVSRVYIFRRIEGVWTHIQTVKPPTGNDWAYPHPPRPSLPRRDVRYIHLGFGRSVSLANGRLAIGAPEAGVMDRSSPSRAEDTLDTGAVHLYELGEDGHQFVWKQSFQGTKPKGMFGKSIALSSSAGLLVVGSPRVELSDDARRSMGPRMGILSGGNTGRADIYEFRNRQWEHTAEFHPNTDDFQGEFGDAVAVLESTGHGLWIGIGARAAGVEPWRSSQLGPGAVYLYRKSQEGTARWQLHTIIRGTRGSGASNGPRVLWRNVGLVVSRFLQNMRDESRDPEDVERRAEVVKLSSFGSAVGLREVGDRMMLVVGASKTCLGESDYLENGAVFVYRIPPQGPLVADEAARTFSFDETPYLYHSAFGQEGNSSDRLGGAVAIRNDGNVIATSRNGPVVIRVPPADPIPDPGPGSSVCFKALERRGERIR